MVVDLYVVAELYMVVVLAMVGLLVVDRLLGVYEQLEVSLTRYYCSTQPQPRQAKLG